MKWKNALKSLSFAAILGLLVCFASSAVAGEVYSVDPAHTYVMFRVKHLNTGYSYGGFNNVSGRFVYDKTSPENFSLEIKVKAFDVDSFDAKRDKHLRSPDFLSAEEHPEISFKSTSVKAVDPDNLVVTGDLTLLGKTRQISVHLKQTGFGKDPWGKFRRGFETTFSIKRSDFGMTYMLSGISDEVQLTVSFEGIWG